MANSPASTSSHGSIKTGSESSLENEGSLVARYDFVWESGKGSGRTYQGYGGDYIEIKRFDPEGPSQQAEASSLRDESTNGDWEALARCRAYFVYGNCNATYSCKLSDEDDKFYDFKLLRRNNNMKEGLAANAMTFKMIDGMVDDDGYSLLYWHMDCGYSGGGEVEIYGWAKKRSGHRPAVLSEAETKRIEIHEDQYYGSD